jgi:hypothetical protein
MAGYLNTKFSDEVKKAGPTVFVLCQAINVAFDLVEDCEHTKLADRYFKGLGGKYKFDLHFILQEQGCEAGDWFGNRSNSVEVNLEAGIYKVLAKIEASRNANAPEVQDVVVKLVEKNTQKLREIGISYDIANARGGTSELSDEQRRKREQKKRGNTEKKKKQIEEEAREKEDFEAWKKEEKVSTKLGRERRHGIRESRLRKLPQIEQRRLKASKIRHQLLATLRRPNTTRHLLPLCMKSGLR